MSLIELRGADAINYAEAHNLKLKLAAHGDNPARDDVAPDQAWAFIEQHDPSLISIEMHAGVNTADEPMADDIPYGKKEED